MEEESLGETESSLTDQVGEREEEKVIERHKKLLKDKKKFIPLEEI